MTTKPVIRFRIDFNSDSHVGPGKIDLLEAIQSSGSLSQAARDLGMSYRRAWLLVHSLNSAFNEPVTRASTGGRGGGGVVLTPFGATLVERYRRLEREFAALAARRLGGIHAAVAEPPAGRPKSKRDAKPQAAAARRPLTRRETRP
jgi:molybdate transport system regulatory protein